MISQIGPKMPAYNSKECLKLRARLKKFQRLHSTHSFTLIELLLVVVLLGTIAGLAIPNFAPALVNFQLKETANNISYLMRYAQSRAIIKNNTHELSFDAQYSRYQVLQSSENEDVFAPIPSRMGRVFRIPEEVTVESDDRSVKFFPDGKIDKTRIFLSNRRDSFMTISTQEQVGRVHVFDFKVQ